MQNYCAARKWKHLQRHLPQGDCPAYSQSERPLITLVILCGEGGGGEGGIAKTTNETPIFFSITSNAKMKKEIQIHFSKWCENEKEKRSSNPFFKVRRKTKTVSEIWIPLSYAIEKRLTLRYMDWGTSQKTSCVERIVPGNSSTVVSQQLLLIAHDC